MKHNIYSLFIRIMIKVVKLSYIVLFEQIQQMYLQQKSYLFVFDTNHISE